VLTFWRSAFLFVCVWFNKEETLALRFKTKLCDAAHITSASSPLRFPQALVLFHLVLPATAGAPLLVFPPDRSSRECACARVACVSV
jgi:hypothetical protein